SASLRLLRPVVGKDDVKSSMERAAAMAGDRSLPTEHRVIAIDFLALGDPLPYAPLLTSLIVPREELPIQLSAFRTLGSTPDNSIASDLLRPWPSLTPGRQRVAAGSPHQNGERVARSREAVEAGTISGTTTAWPSKVGLLHQELDASN